MRAAIAFVAICLFAGFAAPVRAEPADASTPVKKGKRGKRGPVGPPGPSFASVDTKSCLPDGTGWTVSPSNPGNLECAAWCPAGQFGASLRAEWTQSGPQGVEVAQFVLRNGLWGTPVVSVSAGSVPTQPAYALTVMCKTQ